MWRHVSACLWENPDEEEPCDFQGELSQFSILYDQDQDDDDDDDYLTYCRIPPKYFSVREEDSDEQDEEEYDDDDGKAATEHFTCGMGKPRPS